MNKPTYKLSVNLFFCAIALCAGPLWAADHETDCKDGIDNDNDTVYDCSDADCFSQAHCKDGQGDENTNESCGDWVDNDGDGVKDCEDMDCNAPGITICYGSWDLRKAKIAKIEPESTSNPIETLPEFKKRNGH
jgi:hypothetical protein